MNELIQKKLTKNDLKENIIKETDAQLPSSRREIEEDMLEQICLIANAGAEITVEELCSRSHLWRNLWKLCSQISKDCCIWSLNSYGSEIIHSDSGMDDHRMCRIRYTWNCPSVL